MNGSSNKKQKANAADIGEALRLDLTQCRERIRELAWTESLLAGENRILEAVARGHALPEILAGICRLLEEHCNGSLCGILLVNHDGNCMEHGAAPRLPQAYNSAIHGSPMSANAGACGQAASSKMQVIVSDIAMDPAWHDSAWRTLAVSHGLRACWSTPILACDRNVLGTFAMYWREPRSPTTQDQKLINQITHLAAVAIERRCVEEAMRAAKGRFEGILEIADDAIISVDSAQRIVLFNQGAERVFGYTQTEVIGRSLDLLLPQRFAHAHHEHIKAFGKSPEVSRLMGQRREVFGRRKDGSEFPAEASISKLDLGSDVLFTVILRDVTEQRRLQDRLRRSEHNLAEGQRLTKTGSWILDFKTGNTDWSVETCRIFGFPDPPPSPHYSQFRERVRPEDREDVDRGLQESFETGEPRPLKYIFILPDGTQKHIETVSQRFADPQGGLKLMGTVMDVTERVKAQEALQRSEEHLRLLIDTIPGLVWTSKPDGAIDYLSKRWMDYTGMTLEQGIGSGWQAAIHQEDLAHLLDYWKSILTAGTAGEVEARLRRHDGNYRWFLFRGVPLHDEEGKITKWYGANTDIEDRKSSEEAVRASAHLARGQVEVLKRTLDSLATETDPDRLVGHILCAVTEQLGAHSSSVWRRDRASGMIGLEFAFEDGKVVSKTDARFAGINLLLPMEDLWPWPEVFRTGKPSVIEDINNVPPFALRNRLLPLGIVTVLLVPLFVAGQLEGAIGLRFTRKRIFRAEEVELAQALANQAALAMQLANLYAQSREVAVIAERLKSAESLRASELLSRGQVEALKQTLDALAMESAPDRFVEHVLCTMTVQLQAHSCSVWRQEEASGLIGFEFGFEAGKFLTKSDVLKAGIKVLLQKEEFWSWSEVAQTGRPSVVADIREAPSFPWQGHLISQGIVTILVVPMLIAGRVDGLISVRFTKKRTFRIEELELAQALAHQAMLATQLTRLSLQSRESAVTAERNRMARDLHDTLAQGFTGVIMQLEATKGAMVNGDAASARTHIERAEMLARASLGEARRSVRAMRSRSLVDGTLSTALDELLKRMTSGTELQAELVVQGESRILPQSWEEGLLRIAQESLTNTIKYAHAAHFRATLGFLGHAVRLALVDDGRGFDTRAEHDGFGLIGMRERAEQMAGKFVLRSKAGEGTEIVVELNQASPENRNHEDR